MTALSFNDPLEAGAVAATLQALVRIPSVNPAHGGEPGGECRVADWIEAFLKERAASIERWESAPGRECLRAVLPGRDRSRALAFITHSDTVSAAGMSIDPFGGEIRDGKLWGRGSTDAKGQAAAMIHAFAAAAARPEPPPADVQFILTTDEEAGFSGVHSLVRRGCGFTAAVIGEPTLLEVIVAHKGTQRWWIEIEGRSAHSAKPHLGVNSIHHAARLIDRIQTAYFDEIRRRSHSLLGSPTVNVSVIQGGTQVNLVPERTRILIDRRTLPGETRASVEAEFEGLFAELAREIPGFKARQEPAMMVDPPLETPPEHPLVKAALDCAAKAGRPGSPGGAPYGTDGSKLSEIGIPTIVAGPGSIDQAHTADEFIDISELAAGARFHFDLMIRGDWA